MRRVSLLLVLVTSVVARAGALSQAKPDFSGSWVFDPAHSSKEQGFRTGANGTFTPVESNRPAAPAFGNEFTATQNEKTLTIRGTVSPTTSPASGAPVTYSIVYALDGSETHNKLPPPTTGQPDSEMVSTAAWDGDKLVLANQRPDLGSAGKQQRVLHLEHDGTLMIQLMRPGPSGAPPLTTTSAYKRTPAK